MNTLLSRWAGLPLDLRARRERSRRALVNPDMRSSERACVGLVEAFPQLEATFADALQFGLPMTLAVARVVATAADDDAGDRETVCARLAAAFPEDCRVAPLSGDRYVVLLLGKEQFPDLVRSFELALERLARPQRGAPALCAQFGVARCPLDGDELAALLSLGEQVLGDFAGRHEAFDFVDRRHRLCA